jgi:F-type H+-transporting ATPase subunit a
MITLLAGSGPFNLGEVISHHLTDAPLWALSIGGIDMSITKRLVAMWTVCLLIMLIFIPLARKMSKSPYQRPSRWQGFFESLIQFVRKDVSESSMGKSSSIYDPFLLTLFFFILFSNILGLFPPLGELFQFAGESMGLLSAGSHDNSLYLPLPIKLWPGITATGDISVTAALALYSFLAIVAAGFLHQGVAYFKNIVPSGIPAPLWIIMWPIEFIGQFTKPFALAIRLLANMTAGHLIILAIMGFIFQLATYGVVPISIIGSTAIYMLEIFVAFLQAYIFTFLTALFIASAQHRH